tara:strand:+ start:3096 stop:3608 length:513 start_codon:yes stop_codon:yes gene_type:complete
MTDLSELVKNLSQMQNSLHEYRGFLETQRENTIKSQFQEFSQSLGIDSSSETIESLFESFEQVTEILDESELPLRERILKTLDSDFVAEVLSLKTAARESELRRMTSDLSEFIRNIPTADTDAQFIQNLMATSLETLSSEVSLEKEAGNTYNEAWISSIQAQAEHIFKNF